MTVTNPVGRTRARSTEPSIGPQLLLTGALAAVLTVAAVFRHTMSNDVLLPGVSVSLFLLAAAVAAIAWKRPAPDRNFSYLDAAGVLTFIGICVAALIEPEQMVRAMTGGQTDN